MKISGIVLELMVTNVADTLNFYQVALGFSLVAKEEDDNGNLYWAQMRLGDFVISFKEEQRLKSESDFMMDRSVGGGIAICILVEDINPLYEQMARKFETLDYPHLTPCGATQFSLQDNNGYIITFERF